MKNEAYKKNYYLSQANYYKNLTILKRQKASVHLEAKEDELFWGRIFKYYFPKEQFRFITYSKSHHGNYTTGSAQCLAYRNYLSKEFVICIDSDYKYIFGEQNINIRHFIFQTYTYSFENHICFSRGLSGVCKASTGFENKYYDFEQFFESYSRVVYDLFVWHIILYKKNFKLFPIKTFWDVLSLRRNTNDIRNQSKNYLTILDKKVGRRIRKLRKLYPSMNIERERQHLHSLGIRENNLYLFLRGHNIYSLCVYLGRDVCEWILAEEKDKLGNDSKKITQLYNERSTFKEILKRNIHFREYPEIRKIEDDIKRYQAMINS